MHLPMNLVHLAQMDYTSHVNNDTNNSSNSNENYNANKSKLGSCSINKTRCKEGSVTIITIDTAKV